MGRAFQPGSCHRLGANLLQAPDAEGVANPRGDGGGAGDETIMDIAGIVSRQMLARYSHIRMEAKRKALEAIVTKPTPAPQAPEPFRNRNPRQSNSLYCAT